MQEKLSFLAGTSLCAFTWGITPLFKLNTILFLFCKLSINYDTIQKSDTLNLTIAVLGVYFCCFNNEFVDSVVISRHSGVF